MEETPGDHGAREKGIRSTSSQGLVLWGCGLVVAGWGSGSDKQFALQWYGKRLQFILLFSSLLPNFPDC